MVPCYLVEEERNMVLDEVEMEKWLVDSSSTKSFGKKYSLNSQRDLVTDNHQASVAVWVAVLDTCL